MKNILPSLLCDDRDLRVEMLELLSEFTQNKCCSFRPAESMPWPDVSLWIIDITEDNKWDRFLQLKTIPENAYLFILLRSDHPSVWRRIVKLSHNMKVISLPKNRNFINEQLLELLI